MARNRAACSWTAKPLIADHETSLQELSYIMAQSDAHHLYNGFIITEHGRYMGMGTGHDLMREITQMQINAARYANPLTQLPGNVPINEHIDRLLHSGSPLLGLLLRPRPFQAVQRRLRLPQGRRRDPADR